MIFSAYFNIYNYFFFIFIFTFTKNAKKIIFIFYLFAFSKKVINSSTEYSVEDMITYMNKYLDTHASKSYYMTIDPDNLLDEIDHKLLDKYHNIIFDKYKIVTLVIVARGLRSYGSDISSFLKHFYREFSKTLNIQDLKCVVAVINASDRQVTVDSTNKLKHVFNYNVLSALRDKMKITLNENHLFLTVYELLKNVEKAQKQYNFNGKVTDL